MNLKLAQSRTELLYKLSRMDNIREQKRITMQNFFDAVIETSATPTRFSGKDMPKLLQQSLETKEKWYRDDEPQDPKRFPYELPRLVLKKELAELLNIDEKTVVSWAKTRFLWAQRQPKGKFRVWFARPELKRLAEENEKGGAK